MEQNKPENTSNNNNNETSPTPSSQPTPSSSLSNQNPNSSSEPDLTLDQLIKNNQKNPYNIRNLCVLAHVDHGKTSLVDSLISYCNIISPRLAGDIRYMDSREDEQERKITMKSSSISIPYTSKLNNNNYLINLIDSPGHIDFSYEIYSALKMVDGALILIDVVEGICSQTESVIRWAFDEKIKCVLVFNKIDKLITTVNMKPLDAYEHLFNLLEKVNALMSSLIMRDLEIHHLNKGDNISRKSSSCNTNSNIKGEKNEGEENNTTSNSTNSDINNIIEQKENDFYFSPQKGNVIFASALDNWSFTIDTFSELLCKKFKFKKEVLRNYLWGEYYYSVKNKKIYKEPPTEKSRPIFVDFILENIYKMYKIVLEEKDMDKIEKVVTSLGVQISSKELNKVNLEKNPNIILRTIMRQWLSIPSTVFEVVINTLPNPIEGFKNKFDLLFPKTKYENNEIVQKVRKTIFDKDFDLKKFEELPTIAYISKMIPIPLKNIEGEELTSTNKDEGRFMSFARVFTGNIVKNNEYYIIGPKHSIEENKYDIIKYKFDKIYYFMGQYLNECNYAYTGNIFSVSGLEKDIFKTATISTEFQCPSIIPMNLNKNSNVKVSITTVNIKELPMLINGLKILNKCDPAVEYYVQKNGEHILVTSGEVHLERCIKDLEDTFAKVKIKTSEPIVNFKEGLFNTSYNYRKADFNVLLKAAEEQLKKNEIQKNIQEIEQTKLKERKANNDLDEQYIVEDGESNIDISNEKELLKSCTPMFLTNKSETEKKIPKIAKHKIKDVIQKNEKKTSNFIQKKRVIDKEAIGSGVNNTKNINSNTAGGLKYFAEDITPNKICKFGISSIGMTNSMIEVIEKYQKTIEEIEGNSYIIGKDIYENVVMEFKKELLDSIENNKLKKCIDNYLYSFGIKEGRVNMLIIKHIKESQSYFNRIKIMDDDKIQEEVKVENKENKEKNKICVDDIIKNNLEGTNITSKEFLNSIKIGFDMAIKSGPLCEENMYGVIFIVEYIEFNRELIKKDKEEEKDKDQDKDKDKDSTNIENKNLDLIKEIEASDTNKDIDNDSSKMNNIDKDPNTKAESNQLSSSEARSNKEEINLISNLNPNEVSNNINPPINTELSPKKDSRSASPQKVPKDKDKDSSSQFSLSQLNNYGPFIGQVMGTIKDCCRKSYLNSEPRLYEGLYLCLFEIAQENVGKINFVISKRRGEIINEIPSEENIKCTIEAIIPVIESFGFVDEIRKRSSGFTNPMLQFYKWRRIDVDPFDVASEEDLDNFGIYNNATSSNIAKSYINKVRSRKGLAIDEKIVKSADKQRSLAKKK